MQRNPIAPSKFSALDMLIHPGYLCQAMAEGPEGASGPDVEEKARLLGFATLVLCFPLVLLLGVPHALRWAARIARRRPTASAVSVAG